jgi:hypothetical protein
VQRAAGPLDPVQLVHLLKSEFSHLRKGKLVQALFASKSLTILIVPSIPPLTLYQKPIYQHCFEIQ